METACVPQLTSLPKNTKKIANKLAGDSVLDGEKTKVQKKKSFLQALIEVVAENGKEKGDQKEKKSDEVLLMSEVAFPGEPLHDLKETKIMGQIIKNQGSIPVVFVPNKDTAALNNNFTEHEKVQLQNKQSIQSVQMVQQAENIQSVFLTDYSSSETVKPENVNKVSQSNAAEKSTIINNNAVKQQTLNSSQIVTKTGAQLLSHAVSQNSKAEDAKSQDRKETTTETMKISEQQTIKNVTQQVSDKVQKLFSQNLAEQKSVSAYEDLKKSKITKKSSGKSTAQTLEKLDVLDQNNKQENKTENDVKQVNKIKSADFLSLEDNVKSTVRLQQDNLKLEIKQQNNTSDLSDLPSAFSKLETGNKSETVAAKQFTFIKPQSSSAAEQLIQKMKVMVNKNLSTMEVQLQPENLGKIKIHLLSQDGILTARVFTENSHTANLLSSNLQQIKDNLEGQGIRMQHFGVDVGSQQQGGNSQNFSDSRKRNNFSTSEIEILEFENDVLIPDMPISDRKRVTSSQLNLLA